MRAIGLLLAAAMVGLLLFNGIVMLLSPSRWFDLPSYLAFRGTLRKDRLATSGGAFGVRALGLAIVVAISQATVEFITSADPSGRTSGTPMGLIYIVACLLTCTAVSPWGLLIIVKPG